MEQELPARFELPTASETIAAGTVRVSTKGVEVTNAGTAVTMYWVELSAKILA